MSELVELGRRLKRSLDGKISYRKSAVITLIVLGKLVTSDVDSYPEGKAEFNQYILSFRRKLYF
mgnify:CR=1 FL=1